MSIWVHSWFNYLERRLKWRKRWWSFQASMISHSNNATDFINRKRHLTINVQACCDCLFMAVVVKWPGSVNDARVYTSLTIIMPNIRMEKYPHVWNVMLRMNIQYKCSSFVTLLILFFPTWWRSMPLEVLQNRSSILVIDCSARNVSKCAFDRLKARFLALRRAMDINLENLPTGIYACFVLHNYCGLNRESVSDEQVRSALDIECQLQPENPRSTTQGNESQASKQGDFSPSTLLNLNILHTHQGSR